jgi:hypothetical protein
LKAGSLARGDTVVSDDAKLYFHLNRLYQLEGLESGPELERLVYLGADQYLLRGIHLWEADAWSENAPFAVSGTIIVVGRWPSRPEPEQWNDAGCRFQRTLFAKEDITYALKKRYYPPTRQQARPLEVREYSCTPAHQ